MTRTAIILSGLPASGKTTVGRGIAEALNIPCVDKDNFLESLFDKAGIGDNSWRRGLSIESDTILQKEAAELTNAVLVSHWRPTGIEGTGTPIKWLDSVFTNILEVFCDCPATVAAERFIRRKRHCGHLDNTRSPNDVLEWMTRLESGYPLNIGRLIHIRTDVTPDMTQLISELKSLATDKPNL